MTNAARKLLDTFDALPEEERREVLRELLRRATSADYETPDDEELVSAADDIFLVLDHADQNP